MLTNECKSWIKQELKEAQTALDYILSPSQKQAIMDDTHTLQQELGDLIDEYSIIKPVQGILKSNNAELTLRDEFSNLLNYPATIEQEHRAAHVPIHDGTKATAEGFLSKEDTFDEYAYRDLTKNKDHHTS